MATMPRSVRIAKMRAAQMPGAKPGTQIPGRLVVDEYIYSTPIIALDANGGKGTAIITIEPDADFVVLSRAVAVWYQTSSNYNTRRLHPVTVAMRDIASARYLLQSTPLSSFAGTGQALFDYPQVKEFAARQSVGVELTNNDTTAVYVQLSFIGRKLFI